MNMKKTFKRFWTMQKHSGGFTLVELIVVIAILAILAGIGIPAYSGYIEKANKQADATLMGEVAHALQLHYYSDPTNVSGGYVVLNKGDAEAMADANGAEAMKKVFGENWSKSVNLKYNEWTDDGLLDHVLENAGSASTIAQSTFLTTASPAGMMKAVTNLTGAATTVIQNWANTPGNEVRAKLSAMLGDEFVAKLDATEVSPENDNYETVISNLMVGHFAEVMNSNDIEAVQNDPLAGMALQYATLYAYSETTGDMSVMNQVNSYLSGTSSTETLSAEALAEYVNTSCDPSFMEGYLAYYSANEGAQLGIDSSAFLEVMGAVSMLSGSYDAKALSNPELFASDTVAAQLDNYISAVKAVSTMDAATIEALKGLEPGAVVAFLAKDGSVSAIPGAAYLAG